MECRPNLETELSVLDIEDGNFNLEYKTRPIIETKFEIFKDLVDRKTVQKVMDRYRMVGLAKKYFLDYCPCGHAGTDSVRSFRRGDGTVMVTETRMRQ
ncbi:hypothetical protein PGB90_003409 [Kerria lacca]